MTGERKRSNEGVFIRVPEPSHDRTHRCRLPPTDYPVGTIWRCVCRRRWKLTMTRQQTLMGGTKGTVDQPLAWVRRILPWPRRPVAEALTRALEDPWSAGRPDPTSRTKRRQD
jgi:hypothetical protein